MSLCRRPDDLPAGAVAAFVEVTDTVGVPYVTGIQRTVRKVLTSWPDDVTVQPVPVIHTGTGFRTLTPDEWDRLAGQPGGPPSGSAARVRELVRDVPGARRAYRWWRERARLRREAALTDLAVALTAGDLLFELEATWWSPAPRADLLPALRSRGVRVATLVYDLLLLRNPQWFDPENRAVFEPWAAAQLAHSELAIVYSDFCAREVAHFGAPDPPPTARFTPGADPVTAAAVRPEALPDDGTPFVVCVGTIEPRKNVSTLVDAMEQRWVLGDRTRLVLVGRRGWDVDALVDRLRHHPEAGRRLRWLGWASDGELDWLYRHAAAVAVPSWSEGYGLPVVEAERRGAPVLASTGGALVEVGGPSTVRLDPSSPAAWADAIEAVVGAGRGPDRLDTGIETATWTDAARTIAGHLAALVGA